MGGLWVWGCWAKGLGFQVADRVQLVPELGWIPGDVGMPG